jgi:poly-gamma-glutamate synthesis protein (capsule biosynthesis protein)
MREKFAKLQTALNSIDRRTVLGRGAAIVGGLLAGQFLRPSEAEARTKDANGTSGSDTTFTLSVGGELMITRRFSMQTEPEFLDIVKLLRGSDLSYAHLEMNFGNAEEIEWTPRGSAGVASYMIANPQIAQDLKWAGIDTLSLAHNHSFDWGPQGVRSTIKHCREAGIAVAGTGNDLEAARAPAFFEKDKGRIALVSVASGNNQYEWAGLGKGDIPGRPGMNPLRVRTRYEVDHAAAEQLRSIGKKLGVLSDTAAARKEFNITPGAGVGGTGTSAFSFVDGDKFDISSSSHPKDLADNLRSIDEAAKMADFVMVAHHNSTSEGSRGDTPSEFCVDFARKAIDAGADIYIGHGWHTFLGIEIYKGKPIIYGLGNFFYQSGFLTRIPADSYESYGFDLDKLTTLNPAAGNLHPGADQEDWCWSAIYQFKFEGRQLTQVILHPIDTGMDFSSGKGKLNRYVGSGEHKYIDGTPHVAYGASGQKILERLQQRCSLRGTTMEIKGGVGIVRVTA